MKRKARTKQSSDGNNHVQQLFFEELLDDTAASTQELHKIDDDAEQNHLYPIQLVQDFEKFTKYLEENCVQLTKTKVFISRKYLPGINSQLSIRNDLVSRHSEQEAYPYIHFLYFLVLKGGLFQKVSAKSSQMKLQETNRLLLFRKLSATEKYLFLLETFWIDMDWDQLQENSYEDVAPSLQIFFNYVAKANQGEIFELDGEILNYRTRNWNHYLQYFEWLGLWECETDIEAIEQHYRKNCYFAKKITVTELGMKVIPILLMKRNLQFWNIPLRQENGEVNPTPGALLEELIFILPQDIERALLQQRQEKQVQSFLLPFQDVFPIADIQKGLEREIKKSVDGVYTFKVTYMKGIWRKLVLTGKHTMQDLHLLILEAYEFDDDHLYSFFMDGKKWSRKSIVSPLEHDGQKQADKICIGESGLIQGQSFKYLYDYGDEWTFDIVVEQIIEKDSSQLQPYIKESKGEAPDQYMDWGW